MVGVCTMIVGSMFEPEIIVQNRPRRGLGVRSGRAFRTDFLNPARGEEDVMDFENTSVMELPTQRRINYAALIIAILAVIVAIVGIVLANSADDHAGAVGGKLVALDKKHGEFVEETVRVVKNIRVELSADATAIADLGKAVDKLESKSVVADLAKELREGKASKVSLEILRNEVLDKADAKTVRRLAKRMGKFDSRINNIVELNKLVEVAPAPAAPRR